jgi:hypothetical protein
MRLRSALTPFGLSSERPNEIIQGCGRPIVEMKLSRFSLTSALALAALVSAASTITDPFLGKWEIDTKKTHAAGVPDNLQVEISKDGDNGVLIKSKYKEPKDAVYPLLWVGIMTYELPLSTDGSEKQNQIGPFMHVSKTTLNGSTMTTDWRATIENGNVEGKWIRRLSPDGKHMDLQIIAKASDGRNMDQTLVFKRK